MTALSKGKPSLNRPRIQVLVLLALTLPLVMASCLAFSFPTKPVALTKHEFSLMRMGTQFKIILYAADWSSASTAATAAFDRVEQLEQIFSDYRQDSELEQICRNAWKSPQPASPDLFNVLDESWRFSQLSGGAFDVTIGPVVKLWREARRLHRLPDAESLAQARLAVGYQNVVLDAEARTVFLKRDDMRLDLGAIAKGYAGDQALAVLRNHGIHSALVDAGGDLSLGDAPPGTAGWRVELQMPSSDGLFEPRCLILHNVAIATSGDAYQHLDVKGRWFSHIVDPREDLGVRDSVSTTVIAPRGSAADALATALSILPVREGLKLAESLKSVSTLIVRRNGRQIESFASSAFPRFAPNLELHAKGGSQHRHIQ